jgi:cellulose synthase/poly-beta-1,6-N-acetylglucosamine synthase-like glycosyltransferase
MLHEILLFVALLYALQIILFAIAASKARYPSDPTFLPTVSIIIAARNEEANIRRCLESLARLTYPLHLLEVLVVDDRSTDATPSIVREFIRQYSHMKLVVAGPHTDHLRGKANAVTQGIESSHGEILFLTDADCEIPARWVEETVKYYTDKNIGIVAGFTALQNGNLFSSLQAIDWYLLLSVAAATIRLRFPVTAVGNNFSIRRNAYEQVGGYRAIPFSVTEDYALFRAVTTAGYAARLPLDIGTIVESGACRTWKELYRQKKRWFVGGRDLGIKSHMIISVAYMLNALILLAAILTPGQEVLISVGLKFLADLALVLPALRDFKRLSLLAYFPLFELYYAGYVLLFPLVVLFDKDVMWKDRVL